MQIDTSTSKPLFSSILFHYSALAPAKNLLSFPSNISFDAAHEFFLKGILLNNHLRQYPPSVPYQQSFWKWVLAGLEDLCRSDEDHEIDECIYTHYLSLGTGTRGSEAPSNSYITHYWSFPETHDDPIENRHGYETITLLESRTMIEAGTTGLRTWRASLVLAQYLIQHSHLVNTSNVLELGSGTGFIGILVASLQLHAAHGRQMPSVYLTDVNSIVLARCQNNVRLPCNKSSSHPNIHCNSLNWLDALADPESLRSYFNETKADVVLGADIVRISSLRLLMYEVRQMTVRQVFDPELVPSLVRTISLAFSSGNARSALIALTVRNEDTLTYFLDEIGKVLKAEEVAHDITGNLPLQILDQVDAELEVKIFRVVVGSEETFNPM
ncbi:putative methyltransferase-domain-containing protein [Chiua virens]|nr:putative methyltransferase-domain-containing protein [Chiua virens]